MPILIAYVTTFCRLLLLIVFAVSFATKVKNIKLFEYTIHQFRILPSQLSFAAALGLLSTEAIISLLLAVGGELLLPGFSLAGLILFAFSLALGSTLMRKLKVTCNCFGKTHESVNKYNLGRNAALLGIALLGIYAGGASTAYPYQLGFIDITLLGLMSLISILLGAYFRDLIRLIGNT